MRYRPATPSLLAGRGRRRRRPRRSLPLVSSPRPSLPALTHSRRAGVRHLPAPPRATPPDRAPSPASRWCVWQLAWRVLWRACRWATGHRIAGRLLACLFLGSASSSCSASLTFPSFLLLTMCMYSAQVQISARVAPRSGCSPECPAWRSPPFSAAAAAAPAKRGPPRPPPIGTLSRPHTEIDAWI
jgi:hypothetical protein